MTRGWDHGKGIDSGREFGTDQLDEFKSHNHNIINQPDARSDCGATGGVARGRGGMCSNIPSLNTGGTETRPRNIALLPCIKY